MEAEAPSTDRRGCVGLVKRLGRTFSNPLLAKELRGRMRGARAFVVLTVYLLLLGCFTSIIYFAYAETASGPGSGAAMNYVGKVIFFSVVVIEIFMVAFVTPGFTAGAISGEKERKTYEVLRTTLLPARKLVLGKLTSALTYMLLLILAAVPLQSLAFVLGGVVVQELALALIILLVSAFFFAAVGMFFSSLVRSTLASTILTYVTSLLAVIGLPLVLLILASVVGAFAYDLGGPTSIPDWVWEIVLIYALILSASLSPITTAVGTELLLVEEDAIFFYMQRVGYASSGGVYDIPVVSPWIVYCMLYPALAFLLVLIAILLVKRQAKK